MSKKNTKGKEVAVVGIQNYAIMRQDIDIKEVIENNLGGEQLSALDLERVKIPGSGGTTWEVPKFGGIDEIKELNVLIIYNAVNRTYWEVPYGEGGPTPPDCFSEDAVNGIGNPECPSASGKCKDCPMAKFGTAKGGKGDGQACSKKRTFFFLREGNILPMTLNAAPASLKNALQYLIGLTSAGMEPHHVVTRLTLEKDKSRTGSVEYSKVIFTPLKDSIPAEQIPAINEYVANITPFLKKTAKEMAHTEAGYDAPAAEQKAAA